MIVPQLKSPHNLLVLTWLSPRPFHWHTDTWTAVTDYIPAPVPGSEMLWHKALDCWIPYRVSNSSNFMIIKNNNEMKTGVSFKRLCTKNVRCFHTEMLRPSSSSQHRQRGLKHWVPWDFRKWAAEPITEKRKWPEEIAAIGGAKCKYECYIIYLEIQQDQGAKSKLIIRSPRFSCSRR